MASLIVAGALFAGIHFVISGTQLRRRLVASVGERAYLSLFSLLSIGALSWLILSYAAAPRIPLWETPSWLRLLALVLMLPAVMLVVVGLTTPSPTVTGGTGVLDREDAARGILRITRHPFLNGVALWAALHLLVNGDAASLALFGSLLLLTLIGPSSIDGKRARAFGERWQRFAARTSAVPFAAIVAGRNQLRVGELGAWRLGLSLLVYLALFVFHGRLFGAPVW